jgi:hypothetical protein
LHGKFGHGIAQQRAQPAVAAPDIEQSRTSGQAGREAIRKNSDPAAVHGAAVNFPEKAQGWITVCQVAHNRRCMCRG